MIALMKDGIVMNVQTVLQASAFTKNGWKVVEPVKETGSVSNQGDGAEVKIEAVPEKKKPGRKPAKVER